MTLLAKGLVYKDIAETLAITLGTLKQYIHIIYKKLGVSNKTEAINLYFNRWDIEIFGKGSAKVH